MEFFDFLFQTDGGNVPGNSDTNIQPRVDEQFSVNTRMTSSRWVQLKLNLEIIRMLLICANELGAGW